MYWKKKMKMLKAKKGAFQMIANGMIAFIGFVLITLLTIMLITIVGNTSVVKGDPNATKAVAYLQDAAQLPPQFASLIVIVVIIVGILGLLTLIGYGVYSRMKQ
jgi:hypothetical protein